MRLLTGLTLCLSVFTVTVNCETFAQCKGVPKNTFISSPKGCAYFIYCKGDDSFEASCPKGFMFSTKDASCDVQRDVDCSASVTYTTVNTTSTLTTPALGPNGEVICPRPSRPGEVIYLPSPDSCTDYYMCYRSTATLMTCPKDMQFNYSTQSCDWTYVVNCYIASTTTTSPIDLCYGHFSGYLEYPGNCHYYYRCMSGLLTIEECPVGFGWDVNRKLCTPMSCSS